MFKQKQTSRRRSAFTLIEIMVAAVITIIMVGLVIQITGDVLKLWNRSMGKLSANAEARIAMELLTSDLETALLINNGQQWLRVESEQKEDFPTADQTVGLKLFAPALDQPTLQDDGTDEAGNICAIGYRLAFAQAYPNASTNTFVLFRALEGPTATFNELLGPSADDSQLTLSEASPQQFWQAANITAPGNYLAGNIVDFKIFIYGVDSDGNEVILNDTNDNGAIEPDEMFAYGGTDSSDEMPNFAEIVLTVVTDEGLEILSLPSLVGTGFEEGNEGAAAVLRQHGKVFKRRVYFPAQPL